MTFEVRHIVSLGAWCQVTYQVRRIFGLSVSSPYDWLVTPFDALISSINDEGRKFGQSIYVRDNEFAMCNNYGILYHHEFKKEENRAIITEDAMSACRSKLIHKFAQFSEAMESGGVLLIRMGGHAKPAYAWPYITDPAPLNSTDIHSLIEALDSKFAPQNYRVLMVNLEGRVTVDLDAPVDERVLFRTIPFATERSRWEGADEAWDAIFESLPFSFAMEKRHSAAEQPT